VFPNESAQVIFVTAQAGVDKSASSAIQAANTRSWGNLHVGEWRAGDWAYGFNGTSLRDSSNEQHQGCHSPPCELRRFDTLLCHRYKRRA